jgi:hypothetical protein
VPASIFPTHTRVGDVVNVTGPFGGLHQGQVRVKFQGTGWLSPQLMGPTMASVVVPQGAENGLCQIEIDGRRVFGTNCIIEKGTDRIGSPSHAGRDTRAWNWAGGELVRVSGMGQEAQPLPDRPAGRFRNRMLILAIAAELYEHQLKHEIGYFKGKSDLDRIVLYGKWGALGLAFLSSVGILHR